MITRSRAWVLVMTLSVAGCPRQPVRSDADVGADVGPADAGSEPLVDRSCLAEVITPTSAPAAAVRYVRPFAEAADRYPPTLCTALSPGHLRDLVFEYVVPADGVYRFSGVFDGGVHAVSLTLEFFGAAVTDLDAPQIGCPPQVYDGTYFYTCLGDRPKDYGVWCISGEADYAPPDFLTRSDGPGQTAPIIDEAGLVAGQRVWVIVEGGRALGSGSVPAGATLGFEVRLAEACANEIDDDGDGDADCRDSDCPVFDLCGGTQTPICQEAFLCDDPDCCANGLDDDGDGATDEADSECSFPPEERCASGIDDDGDGLTDCDDPDCASPWSDPTGEGADLCYEGSCRDGLDNDGDGRFDCDAPIEVDCELTCSYGEAIDCENGLDDDRDGRVDCRDPECSGVGSCPWEDTLTQCDNGRDDDGDGLVDCDDVDCVAYDAPDTLPEFDNACTELGDLECGDSIDNDGDGFVDCDEPSCELAAVACPPNEGRCDNLRDDDGDGLADCRDPDCGHLASCVETRCADALDDDLDGSMDCADTDCNCLEGCPCVTR
jgi:hypothetical protein